MMQLVPVTFTPLQADEVVESLRLSDRVTLSSGPRRALSRNFRWGYTAYLWCSMSLQCCRTEVPRLWGLPAPISERKLFPQLHPSLLLPSGLVAPGQGARYILDY